MTWVFAPSLPSCASAGDAVITARPATNERRNSARPRSRICIGCPLWIGRVAGPTPRPPPARLGYRGPVARSNWTRANVRHAVSFVFGYGANPAARVYESIGQEFPLAAAPGWLNLGLWEGPGTEEEAPRAVRRLVERLATALPPGGTVVDVGNGLGAQDPVIAAVAKPSRLVAINITEAQLRAGRERLAAAHALPGLGDATRLPVAGSSVDGVISGQAGVHFRT